MRNLFLLATDKPSRLIIYSKLLNEFRLLNEPIEDWKHKRHIYITSDEEIKEGDWVINTKGANEVYKVVSFNGGVPLGENGNGGLFTKKIILTTDQDLIADGIQTIDDTFLEWFVNNPSCEEVKTLHWEGYLEIGQHEYEIIIPKEELFDCEYCGGTGGYITVDSERVECPACEKGKVNFNQELNEPKTGSLVESIQEVTKDLLREINELKQETLEEAVDKLYPLTGEVGIDHRNYLRKEGFIEGSKWQSEQDKNKFSEEDMIQFSAIAYLAMIDPTNNKSFEELLQIWFEKFKKK
jgi:hypothetical protein